MSLWTTIKNDYEREPLGDNYAPEGDLKLVISIDAWKTDIDNDDVEEEGQVIAKVLVTTNNDIVVAYCNNAAVRDEKAKEIIKETIERLRKEYPKDENPPTSKSFAYELGVMMFNAYRRWEQQNEGFETKEHFLESEDYDICGNFLNIIYTSGIKDMEILREGFTQEFFNHSNHKIVQEIADEVFKHVKARIQKD